MDDAAPAWTDVRGGQVQVTPTGALSASAGGVRFLSPRGDHPPGLVRLSVPLADYPSHFVELGVHGTPQVRREGDDLILVHQELTSGHATIPVQVEVSLRPRPEGLVISAQVSNRSELMIPQVAFPQLLGLQPVAGEETRVRMSRGTVHPLRQLRLRPDDATLLELPLQAYYGYGAFEFSMKWLDYGAAEGGLTLYSRDGRYTAQGLLVDRPDRNRDEVDLRWLHFPSIAPGETWESGDFVLLLHEGDWYAGARAYQEFAAEAYPYDAPREIQEALGIRSVWPAVRNAPPTFPIERLPEYAAEIADPDLGLAELCVWHWWQRNGLPILLDPRLGDEEQLRTALSACRALGVVVSLFVSHHLLRDSDETPPEWRHLNAAGQPVQDDWTYGRDYLPRWHVPFAGTHAMMRGSALAPGWRKEALAEYAQLLDLGARSICFDQFWSWFEPNYSPHADGRPDEEGERLLEFGAAAKALIRERDPRGTFSGEMPTDLKVPLLDWTWEWRNAVELEDDAPFRYVFPKVRLNANVNEHPRGAILGFADGGLLNLMPGQMLSHPLADHPDLLRVVRQLARLRRRLLRFFVDGQYRHAEGVHVQGGAHARAYSHGDDVLLVVANPSDETAEVAVEVDPTAWGGAPGPFASTLVALDGTESQHAGAGFHGLLEPDSLVVVELRAGGLR